jgi:hypothetical protein
VRRLERKLYTFTFHDGLLKVYSDKLKVNNAVKAALAAPEYTFDHSFETEIEYRSAQDSKRTKFVIHHCIYGVSMNGTLRDWTNEQKLVPWVAIAVQLPVCAFRHGG